MTGLPALEQQPSPHIRRTRSATSAAAILDGVRTHAGTLFSDLSDVYQCIDILSVILSVLMSLCHVQVPVTIKDALGEN